MKPVPFLKFPGLVREQILLTVFNDELGVFDLSTLAGLSKRAHRVVQSIKYPLTGFIVRIDRETTALEYIVGNTSKAVTFFDYRPDDAFIPIRRASWFDRCHSKKTLTYNDRKIIKKSVQDLIAIFNRPVLAATLNCNRIDPIDLPDLFPFTQCQQMTVYGFKPMPNHKLVFLLEKANPSKFLCVELPIEEDFTMDLGKLSVENLEFDRNSHWITLENLKQAKCIESRFSLSNFSVKDLEGIVENWMQNLDDKKFRLMIINLKEAPTEKINLKRFKASKWDEKKRGEVFMAKYVFLDWYHGHSIDLSKGLDIERSDGLMATVLFEHRYFILAVWHERFPNSEETQKTSVID